MGKKLQEKEVFIPLSGGADTEADPRLPRPSSMVTENADFSVPGVVRKREPLAVLYGNEVSDVATNVPVTNIAPSASGESVFLFGSNTYETGESGEIVQSSYGINRSESVRISTASQLEVSAVNVEFADMVFHSATEEQQQVILVNSTAYVVGKSSGVLQGTSISSLSLYDRSNAAYSMTSTGSTYQHRSWDGSSWSANTSIVATKGVGGYFFSFSNSATHVITIGINSTTNIVATLVNVDSGTELDVVQINAGAGEHFTDIFAADTGIGSTSGDILFASMMRRNSNADTQITAGYFSWSGDTLSLGHSDTADVAGWSPRSVSIQEAYGGTINPVVMCFTDDNSIAYTDVFSYTKDGSLAQDFPNLYGVVPVSGATNSSNNVCFLAKREGGRHWHDTNTAYDLNSPQNDLICVSKESGQPVSIVSRFKRLRHRNDADLNVLAPIRSYYNNDEGEYQKYSSIAIPSRVINQVVKGSFVNRIDINFDRQDVEAVQYGDYTMLPGGSPKVYDGTTCISMGSPDYPEGLVVTNSNTANGDFTNSGGAGTYYYSATYSFQDALGNETESSPSPSVGITFTNVNTNVNVSLAPSPVFFHEVAVNTYGLNSKIPRINLYRTSESSNDFFLIDSNSDSSRDTELAFTDSGKFGFSTTSGLDKLYTAKALYTLNGSLANDPARQHHSSCVHLGRYCYADDARGDTDVYYSKAGSVGISPEFSDILKIECSSSGGDIRSLVSAWDKLFVFKERSIFVTYGQPLNNAGAGQGFADPRLLSGEYGVIKQRAASHGAGHIFFINNLDGLIYTIGANEGVSPIGGPVRHYCETYDYDNVWFNPRNNMVKFSSKTDGAPVLAYDYKYKRWTTLTGRYAGGVLSAFAAPVGAAYGFGTDVVDVILDSSNKLYVQDPLGTFGTTEDYDLSVDTSWISLNDIAGYGKFYEWTLLGGRPSGNCNVVCKTAYAYEPYWVDSTEVNITANTFASPLSGHFGAMTNANAVDKSFKWEFDGSRHKTDSVRIQVATNSGTERDNIELVGIRCKIGVKPGAYRTGEARHQD